MAKSLQKYGLPYMGSKSTIAEWVISHLPKADTLVDAFAGGCALTHAAMLSRKFKRIIANDITDAPKLFIDAANGMYRDEKRWISRDEFMANKDHDPFTRIIWSFGNNQRYYIYAKDIEERKHAIHNAVHDRKTAQLSAIGLIDQEDAEPLEKRLESIENGTEKHYFNEKLDFMKKNEEKNEKNHIEFEENDKEYIMQELNKAFVVVNTLSGGLSPVHEILCVSTNRETAEKYNELNGGHYSIEEVPNLFVNSKYPQPLCEEDKNILETCIGKDKKAEEDKELVEKLQNPPQFPTFDSEGFTKIIGEQAQKTAQVSHDLEMKRIKAKLIADLCIELVKMPVRHEDVPQIAREIAYKALKEI